LIPKQHATSDTCAVDGEEFVMQFTEERSLITLGWIHTHPKRSCFMSSVDLHRHSGLQRMLPESFAVVIAPNSTPNFGVFRLTGPGLQTILECQASEAFHPHPDRSIYTEADNGDNGHVKFADLPLEIVDLRAHTALESIDGESSITSSSRRGALAAPSEDTVKIFKGSPSRYPYSEAASLGEVGKNEAADGATTVAKHDELQETPRQHHVTLPPSNHPAQRTAGPALLTEAFLQPAVSEHNRNFAPRNATSATQAVMNPTTIVSEGFDMSHRAPEHGWQIQQADYLRILQDKFDTPQPDRNHRYSYTDDTSINNEYGNRLENFVDPDNESYDGRHSLKSVSKNSISTSSIASPASSQATSIFY